eukprot:scaffold3084_cov144-Cylindrotheca_fusiformis.AAC.25
METTITPTAQKLIKLVKLQREKTCSSPYFPIPGFARHSHPACAPCMGDPDDRFSRFNYVDPAVYLSLLHSHQKELVQEVQSTPTTSMDHVFASMALEMVTRDIQNTNQESLEESKLQDEINKPTSGFYQPQRPELSLGSTMGSMPATEIADQSDHPSTPKLSSTSKGSDNKTRLEKLAGSLYMDESTSFQFYQSADGQLVYLNGFNMTCLLSDFSRSKPENADSIVYPLPDTIEGRILEVERKNLTPELRKRLNFLSHLPLFTEIVFVELDLNHILTDQTKQKFKQDLARRRKRRQYKVKAEKRADRAAEKEETERINERRARLQLIDLEDDFFRHHVGEEPTLTAEDFIAVIGGASEETTLPASRRNEQGLSFSSAVQRDNGLVVSSPEAFPALGSATSVSAVNSSKKATGQWDAKPIGGFTGLPGKKNGGGKKKARKGKLLFSTGGKRGAGY